MHVLFCYACVISNRVPSFCDGRWVLKTLIVVRTMLVAGCTVLTTFYVLTTAVVPGTRAQAAEAQSAFVV